MITNGDQANDLDICREGLGRAKQCGEFDVPARDRAMSIPYSNPQVLIVGAGPAGLVLACELARRGVGFRLVEQRPEPLLASRGKGLQPRTLEVLEDLGVLPDILAVGASYPPLRFVKGDTILGERRLNEEVAPTPDIPYPNLLMAAQWRTEAVLRAHLATLGVRIDAGTALRSFSQDELGVSADVEGPNGLETIRAQYLIGADGGRSTVRELLGVGFPGKVMEGTRLLFGDVEIDGLGRDAWSMWPAEGALFALCPLPHTTTFQLTARLRPDENPGLDRESIAGLVRQRTGRSDLHVTSVGWLSTFTPHLRLAERYRVGRVFLAGDAAHVHPPTGAQGLNTSIQDAYNLGWKLGLVLAGASPALLDTYEAERRAVAAGMLKLSGDLAGQSMETQTRGREVQQLDINYRESPLARARGGASGNVAAGDRAPDSPYPLPDKRVGRLFDAFRGPHFTLLLFGGAPEPTGLERWPIRTLRLSVSADGPAGIYGVDSDAAVLVRPDKYIAMFDRAPTARSAAAWFADCIAAERASAPVPAPAS